MQKSMNKFLYYKFLSLGYNGYDLWLESNENDARASRVLIKRDTGCAHSHDRKTEIRFPAECTDRKIIPFRATKSYEQGIILSLITLLVLALFPTKFHGY